VAGRLAWMFFCYLWTSEFIIAMGLLIVAIAVSKWYFVKPDARGVVNGNSMLASGYWNTLRYDWEYELFFPIKIIRSSGIISELPLLVHLSSPSLNSFVIGFYT
jgi:hypothetical protein